MSRVGIDELLSYATTKLMELFTGILPMLAFSLSATSYPPVPIGKTIANLLNPYIMLRVLGGGLTPSNYYYK